MCQNNQFAPPQVTRKIYPNLKIYKAHVDSVTVRN